MIAIQTTIARKTTTGVAFRHAYPQRRRLRSLPHPRGKARMGVRRGQGDNFTCRTPTSVLPLEGGGNRFEARVGSRHPTLVPPAYHLAGEKCGVRETLLAAIRRTPRSQ